MSSPVYTEQPRNDQTGAQVISLQLLWPIHHTTLRVSEWEYKTHNLILSQITRGREGLGLNDQGFIVTTDTNNITWVCLQNNWAIRLGISEVTKAVIF